MNLTKSIILGLLVILALSSYQIYQRGYFTLFNMEKVKRINPSDAQQLLSEKPMTILDVRDENEYTISHLEGALRYQEDLLTGLDKSKPIMVYCTVALRSNKLAKRLQKQGFSEVYELKNGLIGWSNASLPMKDSNNELTEEVHVYNRFFGAFLKKGIPIY